MPQFVSTISPFTVLALLTSACGATENHTMFCQFDRRTEHRDVPPKFTVEEIPAHICTDILVGFFSIDSQRLTLGSGREVLAIREMEGRLASMQRDHPYLRKHLTIGTPDATPPNRHLLTVIGHVSRARVFLNFIKIYLRKWRYDGLNIYWSSTQLKSDEDLKLLTFLRLVDSAFREATQPSDGGEGQRRWTISLTVCAFPLLGHLNSTLQDVHHYIDFLIVKAFDTHTDSRPTQTYTHPLYLNQFDLEDANHKPLGQAHAVTWWEALGTPPVKIVMALPTYARALLMPSYRRSGSRSSSPLYPRSVYSASIIVSRAEVCRIVGEAPYMWAELYDPQWHASFFIRPRSTGIEWIFYSNSRAIKERCEWLVAAGYSGLMVWTLDMDDFTGDCGLGKYPITTSGYDCLSARGIRTANRTSTRREESLDMPIPTVAISTSEGHFYFGIILFWFAFLGVLFINWYVRQDSWSQEGEVCD